VAKQAINTGQTERVMKISANQAVKRKTDSLKTKSKGGKNEQL
jgi:hypothetical protein